MATGRYGSTELTGRERQIAALVWEGLTNAEVGKRLGSSEYAVRNSLGRIYDKLGVWNRVELALWYEVQGKGRAEMSLRQKWAPDPALAPDAGDFFRVITLDHIAQCSQPDCGQETRLAAESRDAALLPYCDGHAHIVFADWMVGA